MPEQLEDPLDISIDLDDDEIRFLASLARRAYSAVIREPHPINLMTPGHEFRAPRNLRIAALAFEFPNLRNYVKYQDKRSQPSPDRLGYKYKHVLLDDRERANYILERSKKFLSECKDHDKSPHFVLLNELALCFDNMEVMMDRWRRLAKAFGCYIVPGTFHCTETSFSVAPIFAPNDKLEEILKQNPAKRQKEHIRTPDARSIQVLQTDFGNIIVWICLDLYDPGLVLKFLSITNRLAERSGKSGTHQDIHAVLVPSFNKDRAENIQGAVQILSRFSHVPIICSNSYFATKKSQLRLETIGYYGKEPIQDLTASSLKWPQDSTSKCALFEIDFKSLREKMKELPHFELPYSRVFGAIITGEGVRSVRP